MCRNRRSCTYLFWRHSCFYTLIKQRGRWTEEEHKKFLEALKLYRRAWRRIEGTVDGSIKAWNVDANRVVCDLNTTDAFPSVVDIKCSTVEPLFVSAASSRSEFLDDIRIRTETTNGISPSNDYVIGAKEE
ncbi:hypothetical protein L2E82_05110 [Cichorium intybus]|uniref:Uncharacterized protein n=1 Tax=Cichorium intybus TaxID=13427 RepID=A0ACB9H858_CICIN|nr:hypothetical protein L2E82_05110 [Cichorium intybus]